MTRAEYTPNHRQIPPEGFPDPEAMKIVERAMSLPPEARAKLMRRIDKMLEEGAPAAEA